MRSPLLFLHIIAGTLGMLSGFVAIFLRKGSRRHARAGKIFVATMISLSVSGLYLALMKSQPTNVAAAGLTFYLVTTAWIAASRTTTAPGIFTPGIFDWSALALSLAVGAVEIIWGVQAILSPTGQIHDYPPAPFFIFGSIALLSAAGDIRMITRRGISGPPRLARHLWRMCLALFIASASIFLARAHLFPAIMQKTGTLAFLTFLPLLLMIFWLIRVRWAKAYKVKLIYTNTSAPVPYCDKGERSILERAV
jgi:hypothetical protein